MDTNTGREDAPPSVEAENSDSVGEWYSFAASPPPHVSIMGDFSEDFLSKQLHIAIADNIKASANKCLNGIVTVAKFWLRLSLSREGAKDGPLFCQGSLTGNRRSKDEMKTMHIMVADVDSGCPIKQIVERIKAKGIAAVVVTSHSNDATVTNLRYEDFAKWKDAADKPTIDDVKEWMRFRGKHDDAVVDSVSKVEIVQGKAGRQLQITHAPMNKVRVVSVFNNPIEFGSYETLEKANADWSMAATGFGLLLEIDIDKSCKDSSRAYYFPAHPKNAKGYKAIYIAGDCVDFQELVKLGSTAQAEENLAEAVPKANTKTSKPKSAKEPRENDTASSDKVKDNADATIGWAGRFARRFEIAKALLHHSPDLIGDTAAQGKGRHLNMCPFTERHSHPGQSDSSTFVCDASMNNGRGFAIRCLHSGCQGTDRLVFLQRLIDDGSLPSEALQNPEFLTPDPNDQLLKRVNAEFVLPKFKGNLTYVIR